MKQVYWQLKHPFDGIPKTTDFELIEENLEDLKDGQVTIEALYLSPDPYQKLFSGALQTPCTMMGSLVAKVIRSRNDKYPVGSVIVSNHGWILRGNIDPQTEFPHAISKFEIIDSSGKHFIYSYELLRVFICFGPSH